MQCPKCGAEQSAQNAICCRCGIVFAKYYKYHPRPPDEDSPAPPPGRVDARAPTPAPPASARPGSLLFPAEPGGDWLSLSARGLLWVVLLVWGLSLMFTSVESGGVGASFLHNINLPFHEFGHILFRPFGDFLTSLGGTLGQLLMPAICCGVLLVQTRDPFGASAALWWFGENFLDIAPYINDARAGVLPLVGGNVGHSSPYGFHDWEYLLGETGLLHLDHQLARTSHLLGALIMGLALLWGALLWWRQLQSLRAAQPGTPR